MTDSSNIQEQDKEHLHRRNAIWVSLVALICELLSVIVALVWFDEPIKCCEDEFQQDAAAADDERAGLLVLLYFYMALIIVEAIPLWWWWPIPWSMLNAWIGLGIAFTFLGTGSSIPTYIFVVVELVFSIAEIYYLDKSFEMFFRKRCHSFCFSCIDECRFGLAAVFFLGTAALAIVVLVVQINVDVVGGICFLNGTSAVGRGRASCGICANDLSWNESSCEVCETPETATCWIELY